jgi:hypothetical protein
MKKFLITSDKFKGTIEVVYNFDGVLTLIDLYDAELSYKQIQYLMHNLSPDVQQLRGMLTGTNLDIKEIAFEKTLEDFKREYPYSRNFHLLEPIWQRMEKKYHALAWYRAIQYRKYCERNNKWYKPKIAASWLNNKEYLNDWRNL